MLFTDLYEIKKFLEIDNLDQSEDVKLTLFVEMASNWIEEYLDRDFSYKTRTQFYRGTNSQKLVLRNRPVYGAQPITVQVDEGGNYGQAVGSFDPAVTVPLVYGTDFILQIDQDDGTTSRSGLLIRINEVWPRPMVRSLGLLSPYIWDDTGSIKITYTAGYSNDNLPAGIRMGCNILVSRMRYLMPLGMAIGGEGYEERSISLIEERKDYLMSLAKPWLYTHKSWKF